MYFGQVSLMKFAQHAFSSESATNEAYCRLWQPESIQGCSFHYGIAYILPEARLPIMSERNCSKSLSLRGTNVEAVVEHRQMCLSFRELDSVLASADRWPVLGPKSSSDITFPISSLSGKPPIEDHVGFNPFCLPPVQTKGAKGCLLTFSKSLGNFRRRGCLHDCPRCIATRQASLLAVCLPTVKVSPPARESRSDLSFLMSTGRPGVEGP